MSNNLLLSELNIMKLLNLYNFQSDQQKSSKFQQYQLEIHCCKTNISLKFKSNMYN